MTGAGWGGAQGFGSEERSFASTEMQLWDRVCQARTERGSELTGERNIREAQGTAKTERQGKESCCQSQGGGWIEVSLCQLTARDHRVHSRLLMPRDGMRKLCSNCCNTPFSAK